MLKAVLISVLALALFDAAYTNGVIRREGRACELNPVVRALSVRPGGVLLGTVGPTLALCAVAYWQNSDLLAGVLLGARGTLFAFQSVRLHPTRFQRPTLGLPLPRPVECKDGASISR